MIMTFKGKYCATVVSYSPFESKVGLRFLVERHVVVPGQQVDFGKARAIF